ncbi:hypothetical protein [Peribacillus simplex]|nr:hypothetical protein [Peribacillus simplex]
MKWTHLLVSLKQILVNTDITNDFEQFPQENGAKIRELEALLMN